MLKVDNDPLKKSIMWEYINEIKSLLKKNNYSLTVKELLKKLNVASLNEIIFVGHGSSYNVSIIASHMFSEFARVKSQCFMPMSFNYHIDSSNIMYNRERTLVIAISQTGTSRGTIEAIEKAKDLGFKVLTITDVMDTPVSSLGDYYLNIGCGEENSNAKTKGVCCTLMLLQIFAIELGLLKGTLSQEKYDAINKEIDLSIEEIDEIIDKTVGWIRNSEFGRNIKDICFLGYGKNDGTILEGMLKLIETMCIPATSTVIEEFSHGLHRYITEDSHIVIVNTGGIGSYEAIKTYDYFKTKIPNCLLINGTEPIINDENVINIKEKMYTESVLNIMVIFHVLSVAIPEKNGLDPNAYSNDEYTKFIHTRVG
ncbi:SIS domain-containing protein [Tepidimicrobium xylanilyticum]|uniref:SIS domain-containing protein n=1 Tax=Tepidimicrobium xylanilyticum TaxID=1123352 RepID=UPI002654B63C|nr:SIS domain-containing protein [Tepidimicrobium xylanilyticum]GMG97776.1 hypothetical protein EN5CB1_26020 [Tepidimicrobium xylanilyticum]